MPNIRRGVALAVEDAARAVPACITSRNGSDIATPAPWRKRRRDRAWRVAMNGARDFMFMRSWRRSASFGLEQLAANVFFDQRADAVLARSRALQNPLELRAVGEAHRRARGEYHQLSGEIAGDGHLVAQDEALELFYIAEGAPVRQFAGGVDGKPVVKRECLTVQAIAGLGLHVLGDRAVAVAARTHHIETLERESRRIHLDVARRATRIVAVLGELLADGHRAADI